jgi:hypothetical protein
MAVESNKTAGIVAVVFADSSGADLEELLEAFLASYNASGGRASPYIELVYEAYSQGVSERLIAMDITAAFISVPLVEQRRWIQTAFDQFSVVIAEFPLFPDFGLSPASKVLTWDLEATMKELKTALDNDKPGKITGKWKLQTPVK